MQQDNVRERLLESAALCFLEDDYKSVTTRKIAERADVNSAMIAYYFKSKSNLFEAVIKHYFADIYDSLDVMSEGASLEDGMKLAWQKYYEVMNKKPELPRLMVRAIIYKDVPGHDYVITNVLGKKMDTFCRNIKEGQRLGLIRRDIEAKTMWVICASIAMMPVIFGDIVKGLLSDDTEAELEAISSTAASVLVKGLMR